MVIAADRAEGETGGREGGREGGRYLEIMKARQQLFDCFWGMRRVQLPDNLQGGREGGREGCQPLQERLEIRPHVGIGSVIDVKVGNLGVGGEEGREDVAARAGDGRQNLVRQSLGHKGGVDVDHVEGGGGTEGGRARAMGGFFEEGVVGLPFGGFG